MNPERRLLVGALCGVASTVALSGLRRLMDRAGLVHTTAPQQVIERLEELGLLGNDSPDGHRTASLAAHYAYGLGSGAALGLLRRERGGAAEEAAVGSALGLLLWGAGWATWLPLAGVHSPPWAQNTPKVLLPVLDHAFFGAVWGLMRHLARV